MREGSKRDVLPDLLRAWALIGIVLVNVEIFASNMMTGYPDAALAGTASQTAALLVSAVFLLKSYSLFSLMFGAGLGYQIEAAERARANFKARYFRRITGLLILGLLHAIFFFIGDILVTYALLGSVLFFLRNETPKMLFRIGIILIAVQFSLLLLGASSLFLVENIPDPTFQEEFQAGLTQARLASEKSNIVWSEGSFGDVALLRLQTLPTLLPSFIMVQAIAALGFFLIGLSWQRTGLLQDPHAPFWKTARWVLLPLGLVASFAGAALYLKAETRDSSTALFALAILLAASPFSTFGYAGWIAKLCEGPQGPVRRFLARGGSATLSAYLMQSLILSLVFCGYGLGLFGKVTAFQAIAIALITGLFTLSFCSIWLLRFKRGPMEILLRRWTYGRTASG
ncbi:DUF418 domain-containing protein [Ponticaulis profundi]|uniref:DUF418 domain-containing protein n=2 Tax=Ponticaulis profundi TaxID=2665222 RepID=A0ABW1SCL2_9PROT